MRNLNKAHNIKYQLVTKARFIKGRITHMPRGLGERHSKRIGLELDTLKEKKAGRRFVWLRKRCRPREGKAAYNRETDKKA